jgi:hypothetical protein
MMFLRLSLFALALSSVPILAHAAPQIAPNCATIHHREFDYFIGNFTVFNKAGKQIGTDEVTPEMESCALLEHWHGRKVQGVGYSGYDDTRKQWVQTFFQNDGTFDIFYGNMTKDGMLISGIDYPKPGVTEYNRVLFRPLPRGFEEYWTASTDGRRSWKVVFDGFFQRR